jgi:hypothetical protein
MFRLEVNIQKISNTVQVNIAIEREEINPLKGGPVQIFWKNSNI